jgi:L-ascorbate metabolism protein UlaG (beta-lactamase superfamily)
VNADGRFSNPPGSPERSGVRGALARFIVRRLFSRRRPSAPEGHALPVEAALDGFWSHADSDVDAVTWLGHAAFLVRLGGLTVLLDPFLAEAATPLPWLGPKRYVPPAIPVERLPPVDLLILSHSHYDHLDMPTLRALSDKARMRVVTPLRLGDLIRPLGFADVIELDWHQATAVGPVTVTATPAVHFSARTPFDRNRTLWAGFSLTTERTRLHFGGDSAYHPNCFRDTGQRHGPFDLALVGIGAYEPRVLMHATHANPEEAVRMARDLNARAIMGMHWGTIVLTEEPPFEPPERFRAAAQAAGFGDDDIWVMRVGETRPIRP